MIDPRGQRMLGGAVLLAAMLAGATPDARGEAATGSRPAASAPAAKGGPGTTAEKAIPARTLRDSKGNSSNDDDGWLRMLGALALVVALIFAVRLLLKRLSGPSRPGAGGRAVEVLAQAPLGPRQHVSVIRLGRRVVLVGSGPAGIQPLSEVTDPQEVQELLDGLSAGRRTWAGLGQKSGPPAGGDDTTAPEHSQERQT